MQLNVTMALATVLVITPLVQAAPLPVKLGVTSHSELDVRSTTPGAALKQPQATEADDVAEGGNQSPVQGKEEGQLKTRGLDRAFSFSSEEREVLESGLKGGGSGAGFDFADDAASDAKRFKHLKVDTKPAYDPVADLAYHDGQEHVVVPHPIVHASPPPPQAQGFKSLLNRLAKSGATDHQALPERNKALLNRAAHSEQVRAGIRILPAHSTAVNYPNPFSRAGEKRKRLSTPEAEPVQPRETWSPESWQTPTTGHTWFPSALHQSEFHNQDVGTSTHQSNFVDLTTPPGSPRVSHHLKPEDNTYGPLRSPDHASWDNHIDLSTP